VVSSTPRPHFTPGKDPVPILQEAGWAPGPIRTGGKSRPHRGSIPDSPARSSVAISTELPAHTFHFTLSFVSYGRVFLNTNFGKDNRHFQTGNQQNKCGVLFYLRSGCLFHYVIKSDLKRITLAYAVFRTQDLFCRLIFKYFYFSFVGK